MADVSTDTHRRPLLKGLAMLPLVDISAMQTSTSGTYVESSSGTITLGNARIELLFDRNAAGLKQITDKQRGHELRDVDRGRYTSVFELQFDHPDYGSVETHGGLAGDTSIEPAMSSEEASLTLEYRNLPLYGDSGELDERFPGPVTVTVTVEDDDPLSYWTATVSNQTDLAIRQVTIPSISDIRSLAQDKDDELIIPNQVGRRIPNPTDNGGTTHRYPTGFGTMQFTAYLAESGGFYTDTRDADGYSKNLRWSKANDVPFLNYEMTHHLPKQPGSDVEIPYYSTIGVLDGSWYDAVDRYRHWLETEGWLKESTESPPSRLQQSGNAQRVVSYYLKAFGDDDERTYDESADLVRMANRLLDVPIQFYWLGWETNGYPAPGDWFPPAEGIESFRNTVSELADQGISTMGFTSGNLLRMSSDFVQSNPDTAQSWAIKKPDGEARTYGESDIRFYNIEFTHPEFQSKLRSIMSKMVRNGMNEIVIDGFPWGRTPDCYDPSHNHPSGRGGNWFAQRAREDLREIKSTLRSIDSDVCISGEGINDFYVNEMDVFMTRDVMAEDDEGPNSPLNRRPAEILPIFQYAFSDLIVTRTKNHSPYNGPEWNDAAKLRLFTARALKWGAAQMFTLFAPPEEDSLTRETLDYLNDVMVARSSYGQRFLGKGRMIRGPELDTDTITVEAVDGAQYQRDQVHGSAWKSDSGESAIILTNIGTEPTEVVLDLEAQPTSLPPRENRIVYAVRNGTYEQRLDTAREVSVELDSEDVLLLVFAPAHEPRRRVLEQIIEAQTRVAEANSNLGEDALADAKRTFESHQYDTAMRHAEDAITTASEDSSPTSTISPQTTETPRSTAPATVTEARETRTGSSTSSVDSTGFGIISTLLGGTAALSYRKLKRTEKNDK